MVEKTQKCKHSYRLINGEDWSDRGEYYAYFFCIYCLDIKEKKYLDKS